MSISVMALLLAVAAAEYAGNAFLAEHCSVTLTWKAYTDATFATPLPARDGFFLRENTHYVRLQLGDSVYVAHKGFIGADPSDPLLVAQDCADSAALAALSARFPFFAPLVKAAPVDGVTVTFEDGRLASLSDGSVFLRFDAPVFRSDAPTAAQFALGDACTGVLGSAVSADDLRNDVCYVPECAAAGTDGVCTDLNCPPGTGKNPDRVECAPCASGSFSATNDDAVCEECTLGAGCLDCDPATGACSECAYGYKIGANGCSVCPKGEYAVLPSGCIACSDNCLECGNQSGACITCAEGYAISGRVCESTAFFDVIGTEGIVMFVLIILVVVLLVVFIILLVVKKKKMAQSEFEKAQIELDMVSDEPVIVPVDISDSSEASEPTSASSSSSATDEFVAVPRAYDSSSSSEENVTPAPISTESSEEESSEEESSDEESSDEESSEEEAKKESSAQKSSSSGESSSEEDEEAGAVESESSSENNESSSDNNESFSLEEAPPVPDIEQPDSSSSSSEDSSVSEDGKRPDPVEPVISSSSESETSSSAESSSTASSDSSSE